MNSTHGKQKRKAQRDIDLMKAGAAWVVGIVIMFAALMLFGR